jgi:hypothetical protein
VGVSAVSRVSRHAADLPRRAGMAGHHESQRGHAISLTCMSPCEGSGRRAQDNLVRIKPIASPAAGELFVGELLGREHCRRMLHRVRTLRSRGRLMVALWGDGSAYGANGD